MSEPVVITPSDNAPQRLLIPSVALNEFRVALDVWFSSMDETTKAEAIEMARNWKPPAKPKKASA
jgi:hypothetical protein